MTFVRKWPKSPAACAALEEYRECVRRNATGSADSDDALGGYGLDFSKADLSGLSLVEAMLIEADLSEARLVDVVLFRAWLNSARLDMAKLDGADLQKSEARGCTAVGASFRGVDARGAVMEEADLRTADFTGSDLRQANFSGSDLRNSRLTDCEYMRTNLIGSRMGGVQVAGGQGSVYGPVDVGLTEPLIIGGDELRHWFNEHGAPDVVVLELKRPLSGLK